VFDPAEKAEELMENLQEKLEEVDRDFKVTIEMSFGIPFIAHTRVRLEEKE